MAYMSTRDGESAKETICTSVINGIQSTPTEEVLVSLAYDLESLHPAFDFCHSVAQHRTQHDCFGVSNNDSIRIGLIPQPISVGIRKAVLAPDGQG